MLIYMSGMNIVVIFRLNIDEGGIGMKGIMKKLEDVFAAVAFAEAGEHDTAREIMKDKRLQKTDRITQSKRIRKELRAPGKDR